MRHADPSAVGDRLAAMRRRSRAKMSTLADRLDWDSFPTMPDTRSDYAAMYRDELRAAGTPHALEMLAALEHGVKLDEDPGGG